MCSPHELRWSRRPQSAEKKVAKSIGIKVFRGFFGRFFDVLKVFRWQDFLKETDGLKFTGENWARGPQFIAVLRSIACRLA